MTERFVDERGMPQVSYWHRDLPPLHADALGEHVVEAASDRMPGRLTRHEGEYARCYDQLMAHARARLRQEVQRLGGDYAHVITETIEPHHDDATNESWLQGRFSYMLYASPRKK